MSSKKRSVSEMSGNSESSDTQSKRPKICHDWIETLNDLIPPYYRKCNSQQIIKQKYAQNQQQEQQQVWIKHHDTHSIWKLFKDREYRMNNKTEDVSRNWFSNKPAEPIKVSRTKEFKINYMKLMKLLNESKILKNKELNKTIYLPYIPQSAEFELTDTEIDYEEDEDIEMKAMKDEIYPASQGEAKFDQNDIYDILDGMLLSDLYKIYKESDSMDHQFEELFKDEYQYGDVLELEDSEEGTLFVIGYGDEPFYVDKSRLKCIRSWRMWTGECPTLEFGDAPEGYYKDLKGHYVCGTVMDPQRMINKENSLYKEYMKQYRNEEYDIAMMHDGGSCSHWMNDPDSYNSKLESDRSHEQDWMIRYDAAVKGRKERIYECCYNASIDSQLDVNMRKIIINFLV